MKQAIAGNHHGIGTMAAAFYLYKYNKVAANAESVKKYFEDFYLTAKLTYSESVYFILLPVPFNHLYLHSKIMGGSGGLRNLIKLFILN